MRKIFLEGKTFDRLFVLEYKGTNKYRRALYLCLCVCGTEKIIEGYSLRTKAIRSCGCFKNESTVKRQTTHGMSDTPTYRSWHHMIQRITNPKDKKFPIYGGRGIKIHIPWLKFENFLKDMGIRPNGTSIDRINNDGNYEPGNCKWSTPREQMLNQQRHRKN